MLQKYKKRNKEIVMLFFEAFRARVNQLRYLGIRENCFQNYTKFLQTLLG